MSLSDDIKHRLSLNNLRDTVRYEMIYLRAHKKLTGGQLNLPHGTKKDEKGKTKQKPGSSEETVRVISPEGEAKLRGREGFVKEVSFKPAVKE